MRSVTRTALPVLALLAATGAASAGPNLLANPGFEDARGWLHAWRVERVDPSGDLYYYHIHARGGGHGDARPHTGAHSVEIDSPNTRLSQVLHLEPGRYRLSAWVRNNGESGSPQLILGIGGEVKRLPVLSDRYRHFYADLTVREAGDWPVTLVSGSLGIVVDDLALERLGTEAAPGPPYLFLDLIPAGGERSGNIQCMVRGMRQWVNVAVTCIDPGRMGTPEIEVRVPASVRLSGLNARLLDAWKPFSLQRAEVRTSRSAGPNGSVTTYRFPCPRFVEGVERPVLPGGARRIEGLDEQGRQTWLVPDVRTVCRTHLLRSGGRVALLTLLSHCNQGVGERGRVRPDLRGLGATPGRHVLYDHLTGRTQPLSHAFIVDTRATGSLALLEVRERARPR